MGLAMHMTPLELGSVMAGEGVGMAVGVGGVVGLAGIRWAVGKWERERRMWWKDWRRVAEGAGRDMKVRSRSSCSPWLNCPGLV